MCETAWATVVSQWLLFVLLAAYVIILRPHAPRTWAGFTFDAFRWVGIKEFLRLGIPGAVMVCMEWWSFEVVGIAVGTLGALLKGTETAQGMLMPLFC